MADPLHLRRPQRHAEQLAGARVLGMPEVEGIGLYRKGRHGLDAPDHLDAHAVMLGEPNTLAAAGLVQGLDRRSPGSLARQLVEIVLGLRPERDALHLRIALLGDVNVVHGIGAAHVEGVGRALRPQQPEVA